MRKTCTRCKNEKEETEFYRSLNGTENQCKVCRNKSGYQNRIDRRVKQGLVVMPVGNCLSRELREKGLKYCPNCKRVLELSGFSTRKKGTKIGSCCRECSNELARKLNSTEAGKKKLRGNYKREKSERRDKTLRRKFGIGLNDYNKMLVEQKSRCAICGLTQEDNGKALAVDHNHDTREVRGLLCNNCNACIGFLQNKPWIAVEISRYLSKGDQ